MTRRVTGWMIGCLDEWFAGMLAEKLVLKTGVLVAAWMVRRSANSWSEGLGGCLT